MGGVNNNIVFFYFCNNFITVIIENMKKNVIFLLLLLTPFLGAAAQEAMTLSEIRNYVARMQDALPFNMGNGMKVISFTLNSKAYAMTYDLGGNAFVGGPEGRKIVYNELINMVDNPQTRPLVRGLANNGLGMSYTYVNTRDGNNITVSLSVEDLRRALRSEGRLSPLEQLRLDVQKEQKALPLNLGNGMQETGFELMNGYLKVVITWSDNIYTIGTIKEMLPNIRQSVLNSIIQSLPMRLVVTKCVAAGYGIKYIHRVGGETCSFYLSVSELKKYL